MTSIFQGRENEDMAMFVIYNDDGDSVLESREKAFLIIHLDENPASGVRHTMVNYDEVKGGKGAALTIVRTAPGSMVADSYVCLG
ncbi:hypothetical protein GWO13_01880 [Candidatus Bathyarchaeota archaeon]|nr:hypothetical protein [Candidatus Bathyarchaeota archaeon]